MTILESYAAHKPVIATDVGNCRELIYGNNDGFGEAGILTHIMNIEEIAHSRYLSPECINRMWNCMRQYLGDEIYLAVRTPAQWRTLRSEKEFRQG